MSLLNRRTTLIVLASGAASAAFAAPRPRPDLYNCEGCEAVGERSRDAMTAATMIAGPDEPGERMILEGRVFQIDGETPAADVVVYAHHTNHEGVYPDGWNAPTAVGRHGRLRGWVKTGADGRYRFDTIKPAPYPAMTMPAHVHLMIGEPGRRAYYIDDVVFDGEFGVSDRYRAREERRGGSGIIRLSRGQNGVLLARRDILLERHPD